MPSNGNVSLIGGGDAVGSETSHSAGGYEPKRLKRAPSAPAQHEASGQRLVIQEDPRTGGCVYTVMDRDTGEVVASIAREDVAKMGGAAGYAAGALIKAKA